MQTFITNFNLTQSAQNLDNKRLGKQRVEAIQIARCLLVKENRWDSHPAVKMWRGHESILLLYIYVHIYEWHFVRGFKSEKCIDYYNELTSIHSSNGKYYSSPPWLTKEFIEAHRSNLIRKLPEHYKPLFPNTKEGLPYIWPV